MAQTAFLFNCSLNEVLFSIIGPLWNVAFVVPRFFKFPPEEASFFQLFIKWIVILIIFPLWKVSSFWFMVVQALGTRNNISWKVLTREKTFGNYWFWTLLKFRDLFSLENIRGFWQPKCRSSKCVCSGQNLNCTVGDNSLSWPRQVLRRQRVTSVVIEKTWKKEIRWRVFSAPRQTSTAIYSLLYVNRWCIPIVSKISRPRIGTQCCCFWRIQKYPKVSKKDSKRKESNKKHK